MIVVIGAIATDGGDDRVRAIGYAAEVAEALARAGESVEFVGKVGVDAAGDRVVAQLALSGIGHVALIRDGARSTPAAGSAPLELDAADVQLALRYLTSFDAVLLVDPADGEVLAAAAEACSYVGARLLVTRQEGAPPAPHLGFAANGTPPPLEVERPRDGAGSITDLLIALLHSDQESSAT